MTDQVLTPPARTADRNGTASRHRRILCVFPRYTHSFGTFDYAFPLLGVRAFMPPQGLLLIAAALPDVMGRAVHR